MFFLAGKVWCSIRKGLWVSRYPLLNMKALTVATFTGSQNNYCFGLVWPPSLTPCPLWTSYCRVGANVQYMFNSCFKQKTLCSYMKFGDFHGHPPKRYFCLGKPSPKEYWEVGAISTFESIFWSL